MDWDIPSYTEQTANRDDEYTEALLECIEHWDERMKAYNEKYHNDNK